MDSDDNVDVLDFSQMATGCEPQPPETRSSLSEYTGKIIDPSDYYSTDGLKRFVPRGKCQSSLPACCTYTTLKLVQAKYSYMTGGKYPEFSYAAAHQEITGGRMSRGARPIDSIELVANRGIPLATPNLPEWFSSPRKFPDDAVADRMDVRAAEWQHIRNGKEAVSAILNMDGVNVCIWWYDSDANPGETGYLPVRGRGGKGGHSVVGCGVLLGYELSPSRIGIIIGNHHGDKQTPAMKDERGRTLRFPSWGNDGFGVVPIERVEDGIPDFGCYALRTVTIRNEDLNVPEPKFAT